MTRRHITGELGAYHIVALQQLRRHRIAQPHLPVQRVLLVVTDQLDEALEVGRGPQHKVLAVPMDAAMLYFAPGPGEGRRQGAEAPKSATPDNCYAALLTGNNLRIHPQGTREINRGRQSCEAHASFQDRNTRNTCALQEKLLVLLVCPLLPNYRT